MDENGKLGAETGAGMTALLLTQQLYRHLVLHGVLDQQVALELIDQVSQQAEAMQMKIDEGKSSELLLWKIVRFRLDETHLSIRTLLPSPD